MLNTINYSFPPTKFTKKNNINEQIIHIISEIEEFKKEIDLEISSEGKLSVGTYYPEQMFEELLDLYHSIESLFRIAERDDLININDLKIKTYQKNYERGYYE